MEDQCLMVEVCDSNGVFYPVSFSPASLFFRNYTRKLVFKRYLKFMPGRYIEKLDFVSVYLNDVNSSNQQHDDLVTKGLYC